MKLGGKEQRKAEHQEKTNDQCLQGTLIYFLEIYF